MDPLLQRVQGEKPQAGRQRLLKPPGSFGTFHQAGVNRAAELMEALALGGEPSFEPLLADGETLHQLATEKIGGDPSASAPVLDAAFAGVRRVPQPINEPNRSYVPGTAERAELKARLTALLVEHRGNVTRVAEVMGKQRTQVRRWCKRLGLDPGRFRN